MTDSDVSSATGIRSSQFRRVVLLLVVPAVVVIVSALVYLHGGRFVETDNAYVKAYKTAISTEIDGVVTDVYVEENQTVAEGDPLFKLDAKPYRVAVAKAEAKLAQVYTDLLATKANYSEKQAEIALEKTKYDFALREEKRQSNLVNDHFISASNFDQAQQNVHITVQQIEILEKELRTLEAKLGGSADAPIESHPSYLAALADLDEATLNLERAEIKAPVAGVVTKIPEKGQYLKAGNSAMVVVVTGNLWIEANFPETDLTYVQKGQQVEIEIDTFPGQKWKGLVESLSPATGSEFSIIPAQNATGNWIKIVQRVPVRIRIVEEGGHSPLRAGLSAIVTVDTEHKRQLLGKAW